MSRPARSWEFLDAVGRRAAILGEENGTLEAWVYPLKLFRGLRFQFEAGGKNIPAASVARRVSFDPGTVSIMYSGDDFQVVETLVAAADEPGGLILLDVQAADPLTIHMEFVRDFQVMWPAKFNAVYGSWDASRKLYYFGADDLPDAAVLGSPDLEMTPPNGQADYSSGATPQFSLGTVTGSGSRALVFAGSVKSRADAVAVYRHLQQNPEKVRADVQRYFNNYLASTVAVELPDKNLERAYDWSRVSLAKGMVANPLLGVGLVAGYAESKTEYRPGYAWFFGRDTFWSSFALDSDADLPDSKTAIAFIANFQRADGKMPHEISQSASLVDWTHAYPYEYASADATPLFIIAVRNYVQASNDIAFGDQMWERAKKALEFSRSTLDDNGFPKNLGVGHGWVEGGPLLPVREELYLAGCYVEALRSLAQLARWTGHASEAPALEAEFATKREQMNQLFWLNGPGVYALAIGMDGHPVDQPSVLELVPEWWNLLDRAKAQSMIETLAGPDHATDWGMRIISSSSPLYNPAGYHFGTVWPLFTGWASVGEYRAHQPAAAWANLKANSWLALDGAAANITEVLSGQTYSPASTASPHQIWSAAMLISPLLRGLFGLGVDAVGRRVTLKPHLPVDWEQAALQRVALGNGTVDFLFRRDAKSLTLTVVNHGAGRFPLDFAPAFSPYSDVLGATVNGHAAKFVREDDGADWHAVLRVAVGERGATVTLTQGRFFGVSIPADPPQLAAPSSNLKLISERWSENRKSVTLTLAGISGRSYGFGVTGAEYVTAVSGGTRKGAEISLRMPAGPAGMYTSQQVVLTLR